MSNSIQAIRLVCDAVGNSGYQASVQLSRAARRSTRPAARAQRRDRERPPLNQGHGRLCLRPNPRHEPATGGIA